jgi:hypothetical protein
MIFGTRAGQPSVLTGRQYVSCDILRCDYSGRTQRGRFSRAFQEPPSDDADGNPQVQDALISMLKLEIGKKKVEEYVEESGERLRQVADEAKEEMDKMERLAKARGDLAFDSAIADINREADEFEEQLRRSREEAEARERELEAWEQDVAATRSEGQFFQSLYQTKSDKPVGQTSEELRQRAARVIEPARKEIGSPLRFYLFLALAFLLAADVGADVSSDAPSLGPDVLYTALAALAAWLALNERKEMR